MQPCTRHHAIIPAPPQLRIVCRMVLLLLLGFVRCTLCLIEQPGSTFMLAFPYIRWMAKMVQLFWPWLETRLLDSKLLETCLLYYMRNKNKCLVLSNHWVPWPSMGIAIWSPLWPSEVRLELTMFDLTFHFPFSHHDSKWGRGAIICARRWLPLFESGCGRRNRWWRNTSIPMEDGECTFDLVI